MSSSVKEPAAIKSEQTDGIESFLSGRLAQVDVLRIEKELKSLWQSASEPGSPGKERSVTRACAMNLVLYSEDDDAETVAADVLDEITIRHPARAILAISRAGQQRSVEAWVSARCHLTDSKSDKQICCEQITVRSEGDRTDELASVVLPLVIPDLPVFMWWRANSIKLATIKPFLHYVDELIVDSAKDEGSANFFADVLSIIASFLSESRHAQIVVSDLNWRRCVIWREALALSFGDDRGRLPLSALDKIRSVDVRYAAGIVERDGHLNQALLAVGWLSTRLGWQFKSATKLKSGNFSVNFSDKGRDVETHVTGVACDASHAGNICAVELIFEESSLLPILAQQTRGMPGVQVHKQGSGTLGASGKLSEGFQFSVNPVTESRLIDLELESTNRDVVLEAAFRAAAEIADAISPSPTK